MSDVAQQNQAAAEAVMAYDRANRVAGDFGEMTRKEATAAAERAKRGVELERLAKQMNLDGERDALALTMLQQVREVAQRIGPDHVLTLTTRRETARWPSVGETDDVDNYSPNCSCGASDGEAGKLSGKMGWWRVHKGQVMAFCSDEWEWHIVEAVGAELGLATHWPIAAWRTTIADAAAQAAHQALGIEADLEVEA